MQYKKNYIKIQQKTKISSWFLQISKHLILFQHIRVNFSAEIRHLNSEMSFLQKQRYSSWIPTLYRPPKSIDGAIFHARNWANSTDSSCKCTIIEPDGARIQNLKPDNWIQFAKFSQKQYNPIAVATERNQLSHVQRQVCSCRCLWDSTGFFQWQQL